MHHKPRTKHLATILLALILHSSFLIPHSASATQYSCLSIITSTKKIGKWDALKAWIASAGLKDEWDKCNYVSDTYPQYVAVTNALVQGGVLTPDEISHVLTESIDPAIPDELIHRVYSHDMSNHMGRVRWHGNVARTHFDTNALVKTTWYADGWEFRERFDQKRVPSVRQQLTAAERKAQADRLKAAFEAKKEKARQCRINELTTNMTANVEALMQRRRWPEELARLYLQTELNKLIGTNTVDAVIGPKN